jgi:hypothetical protein
VGTKCAVSWTATKGLTYYYRWHEKSSTSGAGTTLKSGPVRSVVITE